VNRRGVDAPAERRRQAADSVTTMADDPADVLRGYLACGDAGTLDDLATWLHDDVVVHPAGGGAAYAGVPEMALTWAEAHEGLTSLRHEVLDVVVQGEVVAARIRASGTHEGVFLGLEATGRTVEVDQALFARVVEGRIVEVWEITDTGLALQQLGRLDDQPLTPGPQGPQALQSPPDL
jgi:predicted ester cyclase